MTDTTISAGRGQSDEGAHVAVAASTFSSDAVQNRRATHSGFDGIAHLIAENRETYRFYVDFMRAKCRLELQMQAVCRRLCDGDKDEGGKLRKSMTNGKQHEHAHVAFGALAPMIEARDMLEAQQKAYEKRMVKIAKQFPVYAWAKEIKGFGDASLAKVIGECGDLSIYDNPSKVWKRMGLAVIGGERQRKVSGSAALEHGYSPERRAVMWNIGDCMIRAQVRKGKDEEPSTAIGPYGELYLERKAHELTRVETPGHAHNRAKRYMEKRLLKHLWTAWRVA